MKIYHPASEFASWSRLPLTSDNLVADRHSLPASSLASAPGSLLNSFPHDTNVVFVGGSVADGCEEWGEMTHSLLSDYFSAWGIDWWFSDAHRAWDLMTICLISHESCTTPVSAVFWCITVRIGQLSSKRRRVYPVSLIRKIPIDSLLCTHVICRQIRESGVTWILSTVWHSVTIHSAIQSKFQIKNKSLCHTTA